MGARLHPTPDPARVDSGPAAASPISVVLASDHALMLRSLRLLLENEEGIYVIAEAGDLASAAQDVIRKRPDVLVLDLHAPARTSNEIVGKLRERIPEIGIVVMSTHDHPAFAQHALAAGALGFIRTELADSELPQAVRAAAIGETYVSPQIAERMDAR